MKYKLQFNLSRSSYDIVYRKIFALFIFCPFRLLCKWANIRLGHFQCLILSLLKHNYVANSRLGETVCKWRMAKITWDESNPVHTVVIRFSIVGNLSPGLLDYAKVQLGPYFQRKKCSVIYFTCISQAWIFWEKEHFLQPVAADFRNGSPLRRPSGQTALCPGTWAWRTWESVWTFAWNGWGNGRSILWAVSGI